LRQLAREAEEKNLIWLAGDIRRKACRANLRRLLIAQRGKLKILVNNAGQGAWGTATEIKGETYQQMWEINFLAHATLISSLLPLLFPGSTIINILSLAACIPLPHHVAYTVAKAAFAAYTSALQLELATRGVRVLAVYPAGVQTEFFRHAPPRFRPSSTRLLKAEQVADAIMRALERGRSVIYLPWYWRWICWAYACCPRLMRKLQQFYTRRRFQNAR
jgi:hypothetical protein